jgi:hypothetical protein
MTETAEVGEADKTKMRDAIDSIFQGMLDDSDAVGLRRLEERKDDPEIVKAGEALAKYDFDGYQIDYLIPFEERTRALVAERLKRHPGLIFLFMHLGFVSSQVEFLFRRFEGNACCVDKTTTVLRAIARFYHLGEPIAFDYGDENAYWLPRKILKTEDDILDFFAALQWLHAGKPDEYITVYGKIAGIVPRG